VSLLSIYCYKDNIGITLFEDRIRNRLSLPHKKILYANPIAVDKFSEGSAEQHVGTHGEECQESGHEGERPEGLPDGVEVDDGVEVAGGGEDPEVKSCRLDRRTCGHIQETQHHEEQHVLKVILVTSSNPLNVRIIQVHRHRFLCRGHGGCVLVVSEGIVFHSLSGCEWSHNESLQDDEAGIAQVHAEHWVAEGKL